MTEGVKVEAAIETGGGRDAASAIWDWRRRPGDGAAEAARRLRRRGLVQGLVGLAAAAAIGLLWRPRLGWIVGGVAVAVTLLAVAWPAAYARLATLLERFGHGVGLVVTWLLLPLLYLLLFLPLGLVLRARRRLRLTRRPDPRLASYWRPAAEARPAEAYRKQF
jgi:hypothetical protein